MKVVIEDSAEHYLNNMLYHNMQYSYTTAIETDIGISKLFRFLETSSYIGRSITEISDERFRLLIYKKFHNSYRIVYYISEKTNTIYILHISNCKQDFNRILRTHNYFRNYYDL